MYRSLSFFSGVGGLQFALTKAVTALRQPQLVNREPSLRAVQIQNFHTVKAYDINLIANQTYYHYHKLRPSPRTIETLQLHNLDGQADLWLLSPPCQPYCHAGRQRGSEDPRAKAFHHLLGLLLSMSHPPEYVFLENVAGFEASDSAAFLLRVLCAKRYNIRHFVVAPTQLGIPTTRLRYYLAAYRDTGTRESGTSPAPLIENAFPPDAVKYHYASPPAYMFPLAKYLDQRPETTPGKNQLQHKNALHLVDPAALLQSYPPTFRFEIVTRRSIASSTITRSYAQRSVNPGPMLLESGVHVDEEPANLFPVPSAEASATLHKTRFQCSSALTSEDQQRLRWLFPAEIARLHGFPASFSFPSCVPLYLQYRLLGNSVSVDAVAVLLTQLFLDALSAQKTKIGVENALLAASGRMPNFIKKPTHELLNPTFRLHTSFPVLPWCHVMPGVERAANKELLEQRRQAQRSPCLPLLREVQRCAERFHDKASADALFPEETEKALSVSQPEVEKRNPRLSLVYEDPYAAYTKKGKGEKGCATALQRLEECSRKHKNTQFTKHACDLRRLLAKFDVFQSGSHTRDLSAHTYHGHCLEAFGTARQFQFSNVSRTKKRKTT